MDLERFYSFDDLTNEAERLVIAELGRQIEELGEDRVCTSEECVLDIAAFALNHVRPMYRVNLLGRLYAQSLQEEHQKEIRSAVRDAIEKITKDYR